MADDPVFNLDTNESARFLEYFSNRCDEYGGNCDTALIYMTPDDFLKHVVDPSCQVRGDHAGKECFDPGSLDYLTKAMTKGDRLGPLMLELDRVKMFKTKKEGIIPTASHEGRHRAFVAKMLGIERVPVIVVTPVGTLDRCLLEDLDGRR